MDWRAGYERAVERYESGKGRELDERQLVQLANAAWAAGLCALELGDPAAAADWLRRAAARYRKSWQEGSAAWGRPIATMKALLLAGDDASEAARWALAAGAAESESPIGRYAATLALLVLARDSEAAELAATLDDDFPADVAAALRALATRDRDAFASAVADVRKSYEDREGYLEDIPVADTALALDALSRIARVGP